MTKGDDVIATVQSYLNARVQRDTETVLDFYSEEWKDNKQHSKNDLREGRLSIALGEPDDEIKLDFSRTQVILNGPTAIVGPVVIDTAKGRITYRYTLRNEGGVWRLTYSQTLDWETFPMDDQTQELKNEIDNLALTIRSHRERLLSDPWRPGYHFTVPRGGCHTVRPKWCDLLERTLPSFLYLSRQAKRHQVGSLGARIKYRPLPLASSSDALT